MDVPYIQLPEIYCEDVNICLKPFDQKYASSLQMALNDPKIAHQVSHIPFPYEILHAIQWIDGRSSIVIDTSKRVDFIIIRIIDGVEVVAGSVAFIEMHESRAKNHMAQVSMWVSSVFEGQGIATAALKKLIAFGFEELKLHKIHGYAHPENSGSIAVMKKAGMNHEATIVDDWVREIDGEEYLADSYICSIINPVSRFKKLPGDYRSRFNE